MKNEYIIINKRYIEKRIEFLKKNAIMKNVWLNGNDHVVFLVKELELILSQSTPLISEIEKAQNEICDILHKPMEQLEPLEDLWRKENSPDKFIAPDTTQFFVWIREKILNNNK